MLLPHHRETRVIAEEKFAKSLERGTARSRRQKHILRPDRLSHRFQVCPFIEATKNSYQEGP